MSSQTAITARQTPAPAPDLSVPAEHRPRPKRLAVRIFTPLASLRLTVWLFACCCFLVFCGTLAQIDAGLFTVLERYFRTWLAWIPLQVFVQFGQIFLGVSPTAEVGGAIPFPGGFLLGFLLLVNLLAAHIVRFHVSWKRSGILMIHAGLIVMLLSEVVTHFFALEGVMAITEGETANYVQHQRYSELAIIDSSDPKADDVMVIPSPLLRKGGTIRDAKLPFDVEVVRYMVNSAEPEPLARAGANWHNPATAGVGLQGFVQEVPEVSGASTKQTVDVPSAYVTFKSKADGKPLGTYLLSAWLPNPQPLTVDGKQYTVGLRFKRTYKPYSLHLIDFRFDRYPGTEKPKNFSSLVRLVDAERGEDREVLISMNDPLRHRGDALFQADYDKITERTTYLQVVRNPGWLMPYISFGIVSVGLVVHFGMYLVLFLRRRVAL